MRQFASVLVASMLILSFSPPSRAEQSSMPRMTIMVKAKDGKHSLVTGVITSHLMKHKMPQWDFLSSRTVGELARTEKTLGAEAAAALTQDPAADVVVEFSAETRDTGNVVVLTITAMDPLRDMALFSKSGSSSPRKLERPGARNRASLEIAEKVLPEVVTGLTEHYWSLSRKGTWCRVILEKAPKGLEKKIEEKIKKDCAQTERSPGKPGFLVQCKFDSLELASRINKTVETAAPRAKYDIAAKTARLIKLVFEIPKKKGRKKRR